MLLLLNFFIGGYFILIHHHAIHMRKIWLITSIFTCASYLKPYHKLHHVDFLNNDDAFAWARKNESFYKFFMRSHFKRRKIAGLKYFIFDLLCFSVLTNYFGYLYVIFVIGFNFHWELFEYWSHYGLKSISDDKKNWSWNVIGKSYNRILLGLGNHSLHHTGIKKAKYPAIYGLKFYQFYMSYLPLIPSQYFNFMQKQIIINKEKGIL